MLFKVGVETILPSAIIAPLKQYVKAWFERILCNNVADQSTKGVQVYNIKEDLL